MSAADFAEAVRKEAGRWRVCSRQISTGLWRIEQAGTGAVMLFRAATIEEAQSEADRLNNAAVLAKVGPLVEALREIFTGYETTLDGGVKRLVPHRAGHAQDIARAALATLETTDAPLTLTENTLHLLATTRTQGAIHEGC
jgi:hypothetical protein